MGNNSHKPAIRFQGFTDAWEQRKLGELGTIQTCKRIFKEQTSDRGEIPFYKNGQTLGKKLLKIKRYVVNEKYDNKKVNAECVVSRGR